MSMDPTVGGLRERMVFESLVRMVKQSLNDLGWFGSALGHSPILFTSEAIDIDKPIAPNTMVITSEDMTSSEAEIGSVATIDAATVWIDFYCEKESLGRHVMGDVRAILLGKMPHIGRADPSFPVFDWTQPVPTDHQIALVAIDNVELDRGRTPTAQRHWFAVSFTIEDSW